MPTPIRTGSVGSLTTLGLTNAYQAHELADQATLDPNISELPDKCIIERIEFYLDTIAGALTLDFFMSGNDTYKKYTHPVTALAIQADHTDATKGVVFYDFGEDGFRYVRNAYCGDLDRIYAKLNAGTANLIRMYIHFRTGD